MVEYRGIHQFQTSPQQIISASTGHFNLDEDSIVAINSSGNLYLTAEGNSAGVAKSVSAVLLADAQTAILPDTQWQWVGDRPSTLHTGKNALLSLISYDGSPSGIIVAYEELSDGA